MHAVYFGMILVIATCLPASSMAADIFDAPCQRYNVPKPLVIAIAQTESSMHPWVVNVAGKDFRPRTQDEALTIIRAARVRGLSHDVGVMQVNSWWLKRLRISPETALEPHNNVMLGVWILAQEIQRHGLNWKAVASYHTPVDRHPARGLAYAARVLAKLRAAQ